MHRRRQFGPRVGYRLAGFEDGRAGLDPGGGARIVGDPGGDTDYDDRDRGDERQRHDFEMGVPISRQ